MREKTDLNKLVSQIIENDLGNDLDNEEIIHLLLSNTTSKRGKSKENYTMGQRVADKMAEVAGSWAFIISFVFVLIFWIVLNSVMIIKPFDAFPFILLNLLLSCLAAIQAPIIMMSQNRQETKDRERAENDYQVNLKSEIILEDMHNKIDELISNQNKLMKELELIKKSKAEQ